MRKLRLLAAVLALAMLPALADVAPTTAYACNDDCGGFLGSGD